MSAGHPQHPDHPVFEGRESCIRNGRQLNWSNCTPAGFAMQVSIATLGKRNPSACAVRIVTGDTIGGTTIPQCAAAIREEWGVAVEVRVGSNVASPRYVATSLRAGRAVNLQGNGDALVSAKTIGGQSLRSTRGAVNHDVLLVEGYGWYERDGTWWPREATVYDPAADGRPVAWGSGRAALGPDRWPWAVVLAYAAALRPASTDGGVSGARLGSGKMYAAIGPDTLPHVHLRYSGSVRTSPWPRHLRVDPLGTGRRVNVRTGPSTKYPRVTSAGKVVTLPAGYDFAAYQMNPRGQSLSWVADDGTHRTSALWYGNHSGNRWVHTSGLR